MIMFLFIFLLSVIENQNLFKVMKYFNIVKLKMLLEKICGSPQGSQTYFSFFYNYWFYF